MYESPSGPVVVTVPHDGIESALRFAAHEALMRGCPLELVHATRSRDPAAALGLLLRSAATAELQAGPGLAIDTRIAPGRDVEDVLAASVDAGLVVVHRVDVLHLQHALSYGAVGSHGHTAIACVPPTWLPRRDDTRPVVVAVDDAFHAADLLAAGLEQARTHRTWLRVVHAWNLPTRLDPEKDQLVGALWARELDKRLRDQLADAAGDVGFVVDVRHGAAADVALDAAANAQSLLLGRNARGADRLCHVGRTARAALRESPCPVVLLPGDTSLRSTERRTSASRQPEPISSSSR